MTLSEKDKMANIVNILHDEEDVREKVLKISNVLHESEDVVVVTWSEAITLAERIVKIL